MTSPFTHSLRRALIVLTLTAAATPALAAGKKPNALDAEFAATDTNKDGVLSRAEIDARTAKMRVAGGKVTPADVKRLGDLWFAQADTDQNGKLTKTEMAAIMKAMAARYDTNHDGVVSIAERRAARAAAIAETRSAAGPGR